MPIASLPDVSTNHFLAILAGVVVGAAFFLVLFGQPWLAGVSFALFGFFGFLTAQGALSEFAAEKEGEARVEAFSQFYGVEVSANTIDLALAEGVAGDAAAVKMDSGLEVLSLVKDGGELKLVTRAGDVISPEELAPQV